MDWVRRRWGYESLQSRMKEIESEVVWGDLSLKQVRLWTAGLARQSGEYKGGRWKSGGSLLMQSSLCEVMHSEDVLSSSEHGVLTRGFQRSMPIQILTTVVSLSNSNVFEQGQYWQSEQGC